MPILDDSDHNRGFYYCQNCKHHIQIGIYNCPFCGWFNFGAGEEVAAQIEFKRQLILIAVKLAKPKTQSVTIFEIKDTFVRIIALDNDTQIITIIKEKEGILWTTSI